MPLYGESWLLASCRARLFASACTVQSHNTKSQHCRSSQQGLRLPHARFHCRRSVACSPPSARPGPPARSSPCAGCWSRCVVSAAQRAPSAWRQRRQSRAEREREKKTHAFPAISHSATLSGLHTPRLAAAENQSPEQRRERERCTRPAPPPLLRFPFPASPPSPAINAANNQMQPPET